ncbi:MAG: DoxX family protein [Actinomycetota bacterium]
MNPLLQGSRGLGRLAWLSPIIVRLIVGMLMLAHGIDKLRGGTSGIEGFGDFLSSKGFPAGVAFAWLVTMLELVGGAMLIAGLLSRLVASLMTIELIVAITIATGPNGLISGDAGVGYERDLAYIMGFLAIVILGPGRRPSLDHLFGLEEAKPALIPTSR